MFLRNMITAVPFLTPKIASDDDFSKLKEMAVIHDEWNLLYNKENVKIWSKAVPDASIKIIKVWTILPTIPSIDLYDMLLDPTYRKEWDPHMIVGYDIGHFNGNNAVSYYAVSCPPPLTSRDFVLQNSWLDAGVEHYLLNHSVCHKDHPPKKGFVRAISYITGYFIKTTELNECEMYFVSQTDPQGIIPSWIINKCVQIFAPKFIKKLEVAVSEYRNWKNNNQPDFIPWKCPEQITTTLIPLKDCVACEEELQSRFFRYITEKKHTGSFVENTVTSVSPPESSKSSRKKSENEHHKEEKK